MKTRPLLYGMLLLLSCKSVHVISEQQFDAFNTRKAVPRLNKLRWDGYFNNVTRARHWEDTYRKKGSLTLKLTPEQAKSREVYCPEIFFANGVYVVQQNMLQDSELLRPYRSSEQYDTNLGWGVYEIGEDTIVLLTYELFRNTHRLPVWDEKIIKYEGIILNDTTIINWRQVPPYPNYEKDELDTIPQRLEFRYAPDKNLIDSMRFLSKRKKA